MAFPPATPNGFLASSRVKTMRPDRARAPGRVRPPSPSGGLSIFTPKPKPQEIICASFRRADLSMPTSIEHRTASQTGGTPGPAVTRKPLIPQPTSHVAFCVWPICLATRSTGLADMKQSFGARPARSCLLSTHWIVTNHKIEDGVSVSVVGKTCRPTDATILSCRTHPSTRSTQSLTGAGPELPIVREIEFGSPHGLISLN